MTTSDVQPKMLRPSQAVKRYGLPRDRVYKAIQSKELPAYDAGSPRRPQFLLDVGELEAWIKSLRFGGNA